MSIQEKGNTEEILDVLGGLSQALRFCCRDDAFCEGVTFRQFLVLSAVAKEREFYMADLHKHLSVEKSTTTRLVNPLIKKGLLMRNKADNDSRAVKLTLTNAGKETHKKVEACLGNFFQRVLGDIPEKKRNDVLKSVKIFISAVKTSVNGCGC
jgi:DNA-binding MarR family transcriptional regulator